LYRLFNMIVEFDNVKKSINGNEIIKGLSFTLPEQKMLALLGPNGVGKTTIVRLLMGLYKQDAGEIKLFGQDISKSNLDILRQNIGVQNDGNIYEGLTVYDNLALWGELYGLRKSVIDARVMELLEFFDLQAKRNILAGMLSKGMKQKVNLARAIIHQPKLLILDEPNSGLDPISSAELMGLLHNLIKKDNISVMMCTHQLDGLEEIADYIGIIQNGVFMKYGSTEQLLREKWQTTEYRFTVHPLEKAIALCQSFGQAKIDNTDLVIEMSKQDVPALIEKLVNERVKIFDMAKYEHTVKELYFSCLGEGAIIS